MNNTEVTSSNPIPVSSSKPQTHLHIKPQQNMTTPSHTVQGVRPMVVLAASLISQVFAGILFWWPALATNFQFSMHFTADQVTYILAVANSSIAFGILGGMYHTRFGTRTAALTGAIGIPACMFILTLFTFDSFHHLLGKALFPLMLLLPVAISASSFVIYSSSITSAASVLPPEYRGRIVGLQSCMWGSSPGIFAALQAAFFPNPSQTTQLFFFITIISFIPLILFWYTCPKHEKFKFQIDPSRVCEESPLLDSSSDNISISEASCMAQKHVSKRFDLAFVIAACTVLFLQLAAIFEFFSFSSRLQIACAVLILLSIASFGLVAIRSSYFVQPVLDSDDVVTIQSKSMTEVLADPRYIFISIGFAVLAGGSILGLLIQLPGLALSRIFETSAGDYINMETGNRTIRGMVIVFSANSVIARIIVARTSDYGSTGAERQMWKYKIVLADSLIMALSCVLLAFKPLWSLYIALGLAGFSCGSYFSIIPTLITIWFGIKEFARNFALLDIFGGIGCACLGSIFPAWIMAKFGNFEMIPTTSGEGAVTRICTSQGCYVPTFVTLAGLNLLLFVGGRLLQGLVYDEAVKDDI